MLRNTEGRAVGGSGGGGYRTVTGTSLGKRCGAVRHGAAQRGAMPCDAVLWWGGMFVSFVGQGISVGSSVRKMGAVYVFHFELRK